MKELSNEGMSQREIGEVLGVDQSQISRDLDTDANASIDGNGSKEQDTSIDANASLKPEHKAKPTRPVSEEEIKAAELYSQPESVQ